jgi:predicted glycogen debranching enzyme
MRNILSKMKNSLVLSRKITKGDNQDNIDSFLEKEWIITNGLGGYASGTLAGVCTRKYHGLLIAAMPAPLGRVVMLTNLSEELRFPDRSTAELSVEEQSPNLLRLPGLEHLIEFKLEMGIPTWRYQIKDHVIEKRILMPHLQNTTYIIYRLISGAGPMRLRLRPGIHIRRQDLPADEDIRGPYLIQSDGKQHEISLNTGGPFLRMFLYGNQASFNLTGAEYKDIYYRIEERRRYPARGKIWNPGFFRVMLEEGDEATLVASTEQWNVIHALNPKTALTADLERRKRLIDLAHPHVRSGIGAELVLAADQFVITPVTRIADAAWARAAGGELRSIIAGYPWFTDWGRDTMISLEGLTLSTGRFTEAAYILRTFGHYVRDGLIPNLFPEGGTEGLYHTADASLWFFHAVDRYIRITGDSTILSYLMDTLHDIIIHHIRGTRFNIGMDQQDGLLMQGQEGYALTWMDAKAGDWVVTPRRGKAVEINALWYNALRLCSEWLQTEATEAEAKQVAEISQQVFHSFNQKFWIEESGSLYDLIDGENGNDSSIRPNQLFAISLTYPVLESSRWQSVLNAVERCLLTPLGLRSLAPGHPDYKLKYYGDIISRDAAYHQGTVWSWLIGPFIDTWLKVNPDNPAGARRFLTRLISHLNEACIGTMSEVFDAESPYNPEGCMAQAWSVAELLRSWIKIEIALEQKESDHSS